MRERLEKENEDGIELIKYFLLSNYPDEDTIINDIENVYQWDLDDAELSGESFKICFSLKSDPDNFYVAQDSHCSCYGFKDFDPEKMPNNIFDEYFGRIKNK